ncbi:hypothetical protein [Streptomyces sp. NPDC054952]
MTFNDHLQHLVERALASIPAADAGDIYAVSFLIDNEDDDPRQPTLTIGYNTETQAQRSIQDASGRAEARWNYAFWIQNELTVAGDLTSDPAGATARQEWISDLGLWYDEPSDVADWDSVIGPLAAHGCRRAETGGDARAGSPAVHRPPRHARLPYQRRPTHREP